MNKKINIRDFRENQIVEVFHYITNSNSGKHLARFKGVEVIEDRGNKTDAIKLEIFTTKGPQEEFFPIDNDGYVTGWIRDLNLTPQKRTITKWNKKWQEMQIATNSLGSIISDLI